MRNSVTFTVLTPDLDWAANALKGSGYWRFHQVIYPYGGIARPRANAAEPATMEPASMQLARPARMVFCEAVGQVWRSFDCTRVVDAHVPPAHPFPMRRPSTVFGCAETA